MRSFDVIRTRVSASDAYARGPSTRRSMTASVLGTPSSATTCERFLMWSSI